MKEFGGALVRANAARCRGHLEAEEEAGEGVVQLHPEPRNLAEADRVVKLREVPKDLTPGEADSRRRLQTQLSEDRGSQGSGSCYSSVPVARFLRRPFGG